MIFVMTVPRLTPPSRDTLSLFLFSLSRSISHDIGFSSLFDEVFRKSNQQNFIAHVELSDSDGLPPRDIEITAH